MKLTWNWLKDHLETDCTIDLIVEALPKLGLEVASVVNLAENLKGFVLFEITCQYLLVDRYFLKLWLWITPVPESNFNSCDSFI